MPGEPAAEPAPRREVRGEGRWLPSIVTGADGKAVVTIPMPEPPPAWRLTARGCSVETLVGQSTAATLTRKDFFVTLKTPSFLREGDDIRVVGRVHNLTGFAGTVPLTLKITDPKDPSKVLATREKSVELWAICQSAEVSAMRMWSEAALGDASWMAEGRPFITRLPPYFRVPLFSPKFFLMIARN